VKGLMSIFASALLAVAGGFLMTTSAPAAAPGRCVGCDFARADLHGVDLHGVSYVGSDFAHANLSGANLRSAKMVGADFDNADVSNAVLADGSFVGAQFENVNAKGADFRRSKLIGSSFRNADLTNAHFDGAVVCAHSGTREDGDVIERHGISCIDLTGANVTGANFSGAQLCDGDDGHTICSPVDAQTLRTYSHASLAGATLP
jgi:uncharacterized protein YjbI with pentapeptide repeats